MADAVVVLGCRVHGSGAGSPALTRRLDRGIRLFEQGAAPLLVLSGGGPGPVPEAELMRRAALARGVPATALLIEARSGNTIENARETARLLRSRGLRSVLLVSDRVHLPRASLLFRFAGPKVAARSAVSPRSMMWEIPAAIPELAALPLSLVRSLFGTRLR